MARCRHTPAETVPSVNRAEQSLPEPNVFLETWRSYAAYVTACVRCGVFSGLACDHQLTRKTSGLHLWKRKSARDSSL